MILLLLACDTGPMIEDASVACVSEAGFDDRFLFDATTSGVVDGVTLRLVLAGVDRSLLPLVEETGDTWTGEMWGTTADATCDALDDVVYRFTATGEDGATDVLELDGASTGSGRRRTTRGAVSRGR